MIIEIDERISIFRGSKNPWTCKPELLFTCRTSGRVVRCRTWDRDVVGSNPARGYCVGLYQRQLNVPSLRGRLMSTSESWGVNGHTTRCTSFVFVVSQLRMVSGWGLQEIRRSAPPHGPLMLGKDFTFHWYNNWHKYASLSLHFSPFQLGSRDSEIVSIFSIFLLDNSLNSVKRMLPWLWPS